MAGKEEWSAEELVDTLNETAATDKDNLIPVDGGTGVGKSTIAIKLCVKGCEWFDLERDIIYSRDELLRWIDTAKPGSWCVVDEAVNMLFKRDFAAKAQKFLLRVLDMCRDKNLTIFMCIPNFWALDKHILEGRVRLRVHVASTGFAFMWLPSGNPFAPDRWFRKYNEKVCWNWDSYPNARRTKGFIGYLKFGDLPEKYKQPYLEIKARKKKQLKEDEERLEKKDDILKRRSFEQGKWIILEWLSTKNLLQNGWQKALALEWGITAGAVQKRLKEFREKISGVEGKTALIEPHPYDTTIYYNNNPIHDDFLEDDEVGAS